MDSYYVMSVKGENYQLDLSILLMQWKWLFFKRMKIFRSITTQKNKTYTKKGLLD